MAEIRVFDSGGKPAGSLGAPPVLEAANANRGLIHQVMVAERAGARQGTASTKTRAFVAGSNVKIRRQKGTGRSRQGDKRVPHMRGGGVVHGPHPRDYHQPTPRKMRQAAFRTVLNSRLQNDRLLVLDGALAEPRTRLMTALLAEMQLSGSKILFLVCDQDASFIRAAANLPQVLVQEVQHTSTVDVLGSEYVLCTRSAWEQLAARVGGSEALEEASA